MNFKKPTVHKFGEHDVRSFRIDGKDWIVAYDIVDAIGYRETSRWSIGLKMRAKVDAADKGVYPVQSEYGSRAPYIVTVAGARQMIDGSRQPLVPAFRAWLDEAFPSNPAAPLDEVAA
jgi:prophage antirepressor-like protein